MRDGRQVAVKVQRPGIEPQIISDLEAIAELAGFADRHSDTGRRFGFEAMAAEFRNAMLHELDFRREARSLATLAENLAEYEHIVVPTPIPDFTTGKVLTMSFVQGHKVTALDPVVLVDVDGDTLVTELFAAYLKQVLVDGFFHADPHPGNVYLTDDRRLALLDLGMTARVAPELQDQATEAAPRGRRGRWCSSRRGRPGLGDRRDDVEFDERAFRRRVADLVSEQHGANLGPVERGRGHRAAHRVSAASAASDRFPSSPCWARPCSTSTRLPVPSRPTSGPRR